MTKVELERRLEIFRTEQPLDRVVISESAALDFQVELTLKPNAPITERFIARLERVLRHEIRSLSLLRIRTNVVIVRFSLPFTRSDDLSETDCIQELPTLYTSVGQRVAVRAVIHEMIVA
jgi:hypothetical protein